MTSNTRRKPKMSDQSSRIARLNLDLLVHPRAAISAEACVVASKPAAAVAMATRWEVVQEAVADSSTSPTFVPWLRPRLCGRVTDSKIASIQCWLARPERSVQRRR